jgi:AcrR family transcriptional regulator
MPRPERATTKRGARTRDAILDAAVPLFGRHGYRGAPLAAVADAVQLTQPGLLHHFPSKEDLLMAVLEHRDREAQRRIDETGHPDGEASLHALGDLVEHNAGTPELVRLFTVLVGEGVSDEHPAHDYFVDRYARLRDRCRADIEAGQARGEFRADVDADRVAALVMAVMDGLQIQWLLDGSAEMPPAFRLFLDMALTYLKPPAGREGGP